MGIVAEDIQKVKENADIVALISEHVPLKRAGRRFSGCCPFHEEKTPSFSVNPELGFYYCFGCHQKGDAITFLREYLNMDFAEAVEHLAKKANITLRYDTSKDTKASELKPLFAALEKATDFYLQRLKESPDAKIARGYVRSRGYDKDVVERFKIGYSPNEYDALAKYLSKDFNQKILVESGLCYKNSRGGLTDVFRNRLMFPITNTQGSVVGFGARTLDGTPPKYKNSSETKLYRKSNVLYNLSSAKSVASTKGNVVVCEGYTDVIAMTLAGVDQAVATCGTAATIEHVKLMQKFVDKIILCFDMDQAGQKAATRWLEFLPNMTADLYIAQLPQGKDPAELYKDSPEKLPVSIDSAIPFLEFLLNRTTSTIDTSSSVEDRAKIAQEAIGIIRQSPSKLVQEGYVMKYAPMLGFEPDWFFNELSKPQPTKQKNQGQDAIETNLIIQPLDLEKIPEDLRQRELLRLCVHEPQSVAGYIRGDVFTHPIYREIFDSLIEYESIDEALISLREEAQYILNQILVEDIENIEDISSYSLDVFSRVVVSESKEFLHQLVAQGADNTSQVKKLLDQMASSIEKGDYQTLTETANKLLDIKAKKTSVSI